MSTTTNSGFDRVIPRQRYVSEKLLTAYFVSCCIRVNEPPYTHFDKCRRCRKAWKNTVNEILDFYKKRN